MTIFISYSARDLALVKLIASNLEQLDNVTVTFWDVDKQPGEQAWETIFDLIDNSQLVLALITDAVVNRAMAVGNEIGRALAEHKPVIPIVTPNVDSSDLGCLKGVAYIRINKENPGPALEELKASVKKHEFKNLLVNTVVLTSVIATLWLASRE